MAETNLMSVHEPRADLVNDEQIKKFAGYINAGVVAWIKAGQLLVEMREKDPGIFDRITKKFPSISWDILRAFENIGLKRIYPYLLLDNCVGCKRLASLPYAEQERLYSADIEVVVRIEKEKPVVEKKRVQQLSVFEADRVFLNTRIRTVQEQALELERGLPGVRVKRTPQPFMASLAKRAETIPQTATEVRQVAPSKTDWQVIYDLLIDCGESISGKDLEILIMIVRKNL